VTITFAELYGAPPRVTADAPGRVNLIGEHTDYNDGFVLPAALPLRTTVELTVRSDAQVHAWSAEFANHPPVAFSIHVDAIASDWADYVRGMVRVLVDRGVSRGFDARIASEVPVGSGLSSSAALLVALARAIRQAFDLAIDDLDLAVLARKAETDFVGAPVGIMDPMACSLADTTGALFIDTRTLEYARVPLPPGAALLVIDSGVRHSHASGEYRVRRDECRRAAEALGVASLRDVGERDLAAINALPDPLNRRARHVVTENARVHATVAALRAGDHPEAGRLFLASHASMRDDFEISIPAIDVLVERAVRAEGVYGARLTGGGFGGSIVALAEAARARAAGDAVIGQQDRSMTCEARVLVPAADSD
jgi:galactokinase